LTYTTIYNNPWQRSQITFPFVTWDNGFTEEELAAIIEYCDSNGTELGTTFGASSEEEIKAHRVSNVKFHGRNENTAWIFDKLNFIIQASNEQFYNFNLNGYSEFQYTTYDPNGRYDWHTDMSFGEKFGNDAEPRKLSLTLLLNDDNYDFEGGEFQINNGKEDTPITVDMFKGRVVLFPSFMIHRVKPVTKGVRKSLVVWVLGPKFV
jgi:PKHD-type hydroxylase